MFSLLDPPVVKLEIFEPSDSIIVENIDSSNKNNILRMRCETVMGNPTQLISVHWYRNGRHFLTTNSLKLLKPNHHQSMATGGGQGNSATIQTGRHFYRLGQGKHYTLVDEYMPVGPFDGAVFSDNEEPQFNFESLTINSAGEDSSRQPFVSYLEQPDMISIMNITRINAGNYSCIGFNGAANSSQQSKSKSLYVKCKL